MPILILFMIVRTYEMAIDFMERIVIESSQFTDYYKGSRILKSLDEIC